MSTIIHTSSYHKLESSCVAHTLCSAQRQEIAVAAVSNKAHITQLADHHGVSRKFVYQQKEIALNGITEAFHASPSEDPTILFHLPVTKEWMSLSAKS